MLSIDTYQSTTLRFFKDVGLNHEILRYLVFLVETKDSRTKSHILSTLVKMPLLTDFIIIKKIVDGALCSTIKNNRKNLVPSRQN